MYAMNGSGAGYEAPLAAAAALPPSSNISQPGLEPIPTPSENDVFTQFKIVMDVYVVFALCLLGISGNLISIIVLGKDKVIRRTTGFLLQVLAFTDLLYLVSCLFFQTLNTINKYTDWIPSLHDHWPYIEPYVWPCASIAQTCTVWLVVVVTADRYIAICRPLHAPQYSTMSRIRRAVIITWIFSILYNVPRFFERHVIVYFDPETNQTYPVAERTSLRDNDYYVIIYKTCFFFVLRFLVPLISLAFFNTRLIQAIQESYRQRREMPGDGGQRSRREKYSLTLVIVVIVFVVCETPDFFLRTWMSLHIFISAVPFPKHALQWVNVISNTFLAINSCANFVIYCFVGKRFRTILCELLRRGLRRGDSKRPNSKTTTYRFTSTQWEKVEEMSMLVPTLQRANIIHISSNSINRA